jgi:sugar O-acyltransferase (sialic acid O-acetyltransferase NeuD family)
MLIVGAKGFAKEVLEVVFKDYSSEEIVFYDDVSKDLPEKLYNKFLILNSLDKVIEYYSEQNFKFTIGIGNPQLRKMLYEKFIAIGGIYTTVISSTTQIGSFGNLIGEGCNIMLKTIFTNDIKIGKGVIVNQLTSIGHDVVIGDFVELCPNVCVSGGCVIGDMTFIGTGAIILPKVTVGANVVIGAGAVVSKDLPDNCVAVGVPAKIIKQN